MIRLLPARFRRRWPIKTSDLPALLWSALAVCFVLDMVYQPNMVFQGAAVGLKAWWEIVVPAMLPFFIASEMLIRLGLVRFIGTLLEPVMRPVFNVPGAGGVVMVLGFTSGSPVNAMVTAEIRRQGLCTKTEAERLLAFTNNATPLFMLTAVAVGMFKRPELGLIILGSHYLANILLGIILRFYQRNEPEGRYVSAFSGWSLKQALKTLILHHRQRPQSFGKLVSESVTSSVHLMINVGGFIVLFAVLIKLFTEAGVIGVIASALGLLFVPLGFSPEVLPALAGGLFETTIGSKMASEAAASELQRLVSVGVMLGWGGLSVHAMVASMLTKTDISMKLFVFTRLAHALLAAIFTWVFYNHYAVSAAAFGFAAAVPGVYGSGLWMVTGSLMMVAVLLAGLVLLSSFCRLASSVLRYRPR